MLFDATDNASWFAINDDKAVLSTPDDHIAMPRLKAGVQLHAPFMALSFLALSVIPELKVTDLGLVDGVEFALVPLEA